MLAALVRITPLDPVTGERVDVRLSPYNDHVVGRKVNRYGALRWEPALTKAPALSIALFDGAFASPIAPGQAAVSINLEMALHAWPTIDRFAWMGAGLEVLAGDPDWTAEWETVFRGTVTTYGAEARTLAITAAVDAEFASGNLLSRSYAGTGLAEGTVDFKGKPKPLILGWAQNVEPLLINPTNSIYQFSGYGPIEEVSVLYERGSDFGASIGNYADYAALIAADIPRGKWATCHAEGLVRLGAPQYGVITGDVKGHAVAGSTPRRTGAIIAALASIAGIDPDRIDSDSLTALDSAVPRNVNEVLFDQTTLIDVARSMALPCLAQAGIGLDGRLFVTRASLDGIPALSLDAKGRSWPQVKSSKEEAVSPPFRRTVYGANRSWRVHTQDEIAADVPFTPRHDPAAASVTFTANHLGVLDTGQLPKTVAFKRMAGEVDNSLDATWAVVSQGAVTGGTVTVTNGAVEIPTGVTIPPATDIEISSAFEGITVTSKVHLTRLDAAAPSTGAGGGTTVIDNSLNSVSGTTKVALSDEMTVKTGASGVITFGGVLSIIAPAASPAGTFGADLRWRYKPVGGSYSDVGGADIAELASAIVDHDLELGVWFNENGSINVAASKTGLTAATDYVIQLWGARDSASPSKTISFGGSVSATGS